MATNKLEFQVALGLQDAIAQAGELKKILEDSVTPKTHGYETILKALNKIDAAATSMKGKLNTAFSTSKTSQAFLKDYEKVLEMLNAVKSQFSGLGLQEIKISVEDSNKVEDYQKKIKALQDQINGVSGGKIGGFFNLDEFKEAKTLLDQLKINPANFTFKGLTAELQSEIDATRGQVTALEGQFKNVENVVVNLGKGNLDNLNDSLLKATENANGLIRKVSDSATKIDINAQLKNTFAAMDGIDLKAKFINSDTNIDKFIQDETKRIVEAYDARIAELTAIKPKVDDAISQLKGQKTNEDTLEIINSDKIHQVFASLNLEKEYQEFVAKAKEQGEQGAQAIASSMSKLLSGIINTSELEQWRDLAVTEISNIFDGAGETVVSKSSLFKTALKDMFSSNDIDISGISSIQKIINSIKDGDNAATIIQNITAALQEYVSTAGQNVDNTEQFETLKEKLQQLETALTAVKAASSKGIDLDAARKQIQGLEEDIDKILGKYRQFINILTGRTIKTDNLEKAKSSIQSFTDSLTKLENKQKTLSNVQTAVTRWMGFYQVLNLTKRAINDMKQHIQELDTVMTKIAVVTNMSQDDLWGQIGKYSEIARQYGVAIKGVYEVSQLYYQQGLQKDDVMGLTTETLKMARIAGIDYATAADYMTTAVRGFKLEMSDASHVTDVFSNLAANTASSTEELAVAISKTAASAASVGSSFESTSAMMSTMIATTRESATNIGTALKSIISRYGEMKENLTGTDQEGEEYSLNKVDKALQSIGISIHDAAGQFRDFDDVVLELAEAWDSVDTNTQRYIATVMAGNRQQSRFLSLVSNVEEYKRALELANDSEGTGDVQTLKTLDSIDAKIEKMKVTIQEFYTSSGLQDLYKNILDTITNVISAANSLPKIFGNFPGLALALGVQLINIVKNALKLIIASAQVGIEQIKGNTQSVLQGMTAMFTQHGHEHGKAYAQAANQEMNNVGQNLKSNLGQLIGRYGGMALQLAGSALTIKGMSDYGASTSVAQDQAAGKTSLAGSLMSAGGGALSGAMSGFAVGGPWGALAGGVLGLVSSIPSLISSISMLHPDLKRQVELAEKNYQAAKEKETQAKGEEKELDSAVKKFTDLFNNQFESSEALQEYQEYMNQLGDAYPALISKIDDAGNSIITLTSLEEALAEARVKGAQAAVEAAQAELDKKQLEKQAWSDVGDAMGDVNKEQTRVPRELTTYSDSWARQIMTAFGTPNTRYVNAGGTTETPVTWEQNPSYHIMKSYNAWASSPSGNGKTIDIAESEDVRAALDPSEANALVQAYGDQIVEWLNASLANDDIYNQMVTSSQAKSKYKEILKEMHDAYSDLSYAEMSGVTDLKDIDEIDNWTEEQLTAAIQFTNDRATNYGESLAKQIEGLGASLNRAKLNLESQTIINTLDTESQERLNGQSNLVQNMITAEYGNVNWSNSTNRGILRGALERWNTWLSSNMEDAKWLSEELDYSGFKNIHSLKDSLEEHHISETETELYNGQKIVGDYVDNYVKYLQDMKKGLDSTVKNVFNLDDSSVQDNEFAQLFTDLDNEDNENILLASYVPQLRKELFNYKKLRKTASESIANNYLNSVKQVYTSIAALDEESQLEAQSIIKQVNFSDSDSIQTAMESLQEIDPTAYDELIQALSLASTRLATNIEAQVLQAREKAKDLVKNTESALENVGKGVKLSEAIEHFDELITNAEEGTNYNFDDIYQWSDAVDGYVLSTNGIALWIKNTSQEATDKINELNDTLNQTLTLYEGYSSDTWSKTDIDDEQRKKYIRRTLRNQFYSEKDQNGEYVVSDEEVDAKTDAYWAQYETLRKEYSEAQLKGEEATWAQWIKNKSETLTTMTAAEVDFLSNLPKNSMLQKITSMDFSAIAGGTGDSSKGSLETLLKEYLGDAYEQISFDEIWKELLQGKFTLLNQALTLGGATHGVSTKTEDSSIKANVQQYQTGIEELLTKSTNAALSEETTNLLTEAGIDIGTTSRSNAAQQLLTELKELVDAGEATITDYNNSLDKYIQETKGVGKEKSVTDMFKSGFSYSGVKSFADTYEISLSKFFDENTGELTKEMAEVFDYDINTGALTIKANQQFSDVMRVVNKLFGTGIKQTSQAYKESYQATVDKQIQENDAKNQKKTAAQELQTLSSASVGTTVNISAIDEDIKSQLGLTGDTYTVVSEAARDNIIAQIDNALIDAQDDPTLKNILATLKANLLKSQGGKKAAGRSAIMGKTVTRDQATQFVTAIGGEISEVDNIMAARDYIYDAYLDTWKATDKSLQKLYDDIEKAKIDGASQETINNLTAQANNLKYQLERGQKDDVLLTVLQNYSNTTEEAYAAFNTAFGEQFESANINISSIFKKNAKTNTYDVDVDALQRALNTIGFEMNSAAQAQIQTIADNYINNITKAASLVSTGTSSVTDMGTFTKSYNEMFEGEEKSMSDLFRYNDVLESWTLDPSILQKYVRAQADKLVAAGQLAQTDVDKWIEDQTTEAFIENISFTDFLKADNKALSSDAFNKIVEQLRQYYVSLGKSVTDAANLISSDVSALAAGGADAVSVIQKIKGGKATAEEISTAYKAGVSAITAAQETLEAGVGEVLTGIAAEIAKTSKGIATKDLPDGSVVITAVTSMVEAYANLYARMKANSASTIENLNNLYAKMLTANDQKNVDVLDVLESADKIAYDTFAELLTKYNAKFEDVMKSAEVYGIQSDKLGNIQIVDFNRFVGAMNRFYGANWDINSPEFASAYSEWVDAMIELKNTPNTIMQNSADEIKNLAEAKQGQTINVSYLNKSMGEGLESIIKAYGAKLQDGMLTLTNTTDIPGLISAVASAAAEAGAILPEQLAELADTISDMLSNIANIISGGIDGNLSNSQAQQLNSWYRNQQINSGINPEDVEDLTFTQTVDGLKISNEEAMKLYNTINEIDSIQGRVVFDKLKDNLMQTDSNFKSVQSTAARVKSIQKEIDTLYEEENAYAVSKKIQDSNGKQTIAAFKGLNGNVNMYNRPWIENDDGTHSTLLSTTYENEQLGEQEVHIIMTPIPEWAENTEDILTDNELNEYLTLLMRQNPINMDALIQLDKDGVTLSSGKQVSNMLVDIKDAASTTSAELRDEEQELHIWSDAWESARRGVEAPDNSARIEALQEELDLAEQIKQIRSTTEDNSFNFMSNEIPAGENNPLNYYENWSQALTSLQEGFSNGYIDYKDWYNIINEFQNVANTTGEEFEFGGATIKEGADTAAKLIQAAAASLSDVNGDGSLDVDFDKLKINLKDLGVDIDIDSASENAAENTAKAIKGVADDQVESLDALIELLEVVVQMQELGEIDTSNDSKIDLSEVFVDIENDDQATQYTAKYQAVAKKLMETATELGDNSELSQALKNIKIDGISLETLFSEAADGVNKSGVSANALVAALNALYQMSLSDDYDLDNIADSIYDMLLSSGIDNLSIDLGDKKFYVKGNVKYQFDFSNESAMDNAKTAIQKYLESKGIGTDEIDVQSWIDNYFANKDPKEFSAEEQGEIDWILGLASGDFTINEEVDEKGEKTGRYTGTYKGQTFTGATYNEVKTSIQTAEKIANNGFNFEIDENGSVTGNLAVGSTSIKMTVDENGNTLYWALGTPFTTKEEAIQYLAKQGYVDSTLMPNGTEIELDNGGTATVWFDSKLNIGYSIIRDKDGNTTGFKYNGKTFPTYESMMQYIEEIEPLLSKGWTSSKDANFEYIKKGKLQIKRDLKSGKIVELTFDGKQFKSQEAFDNYVAAMEKAEEQGKTINDDGTFEYDVNGQHFKVVRHQDGSFWIQGSFIGADGDMHTVEGATESQVMAIISAYTKMQGGHIASTGIPSEYYLDGKQYKIFQTGNTYTIVGPDGLPLDQELTDEIIEDLQKADGATANIDSANANIAQLNATSESANITFGEKTSANIPVSVLTDDAKEKIDELSGLLSGLEKTWKAIIAIAKASTFWTQYRSIASNLNTLAATRTVTYQINQVINNYDTIEEKLNNLTKDRTVTVTLDQKNLPSSIRISVETLTKAGGTIGLFVSKAMGSIASGIKVGMAKAGGTLMGELGPELVVQGGRYFVAGQNGAEFVDLKDDAIVFNHLQTEQLLTNGVSPTRGHAITNERVAAAYAHGSMSGGIAMASASEALATLKQLRAMWKALSELNASDLLSKAGSGGGGGGSSGKGYIATIERWYTYTQKIATAEEKITHQEQLRAKLASDINKDGSAYYKSQVASLKELQTQVVLYQRLASEQKEYFEQRRTELNTTGALRALYTFDENGQMIYDAKKYEKVSEIFATDANGAAKLTAEQQYQRLKEMGFENAMKYNSSGEEVDWESEDAYATAVQNFKDRMDSEQSEMQSLHDSINEYNDAYLEAQEQQNEILQAIKDNQYEVENAVLNAIEDAAQREIDELQEQRDAIEESSSRFIDGLTNQLNKEKEKYQTDESEKSLNQKRQKLAILQRSGGSASEISALQQEIDSDAQDLYFEKQQEQIDAIQEASDREIEKLDAQIDLQQGILDYEKEHGLLWSQVEQIMEGSPESIAAFINENDSQYWAESPTKNAESMQELLFKAKQWTDYRGNIENLLQQVVDYAAEQTPSETGGGGSNGGEGGETPGGSEGAGDAAWAEFKKTQDIMGSQAWTNLSKKDKEKLKEIYLAKYEETKDATQAAQAVRDSDIYQNAAAGDSKNYYVDREKSGKFKVGDAKDLTEDEKKKVKLHTRKKTASLVKKNNTLWEKAGSPKPSKETAKQKKKYKYDIGGMVEEEGLGYLHAKEAVLTAQQADILRNDILGTGKDSFLSLISDFTSHLDDAASNAANINNSSSKSFTIQNASVNMNVDQIANDYDARRAGDMALDEILKIARKSYASNRVGG